MGLLFRDTDARRIRRRSTPCEELVKHLTALEQYRQNAGWHLRVIQRLLVKHPELDRLVPNHIRSPARLVVKNDARRRTQRRWGPGNDAA